MALIPLSFATLRAASMPRARGSLAVETTALVKLAFFSVLVADTVARRLPSRALLGGALFLFFGAALFRLGRATRTQT